MKTSPAYYQSWLTWAWERQRGLDETARVAFLSEVWGAFSSILDELSKVFPITLGNAWSLARRRFDPLEEARNRMERIKKTYEVV